MTKLITSAESVTGKLSRKISSPPFTDLVHFPASTLVPLDAFEKSTIPNYWRMLMEQGGHLSKKRDPIRPLRDDTSEFLNGVTLHLGDQDLFVPSSCDCLVIYSNTSPKSWRVQLLLTESQWPENLLELRVYHEGHLAEVIYRDGTGIFTTEAGTIDDIPPLEERHYVVSYSINFRQFLKPVSLVDFLKHCRQLKMPRVKVVPFSKIIAEQYPRDLKYMTVYKDLIGQSRFIPMARLRLYADYFGVSLEKLIYLHNSKFKELNESDWLDDDDLILIESQKDLDRMYYYQKHDPYHESLGWRLFVLRKKLGMSVSDFYRIHFRIQTMPAQIMLADELEMNQKLVSYERLQIIARIFNKDISMCVRWYEHTFWGMPSINVMPHNFQISGTELSVESVLDQIFGGVAIYVNADDMPKISHYLMHPNCPGSLAFFLRKTRGIPPSLLAWSQMVGINQDIISDMEQTVIVDNTTRAATWLKLMKSLDIDPEIQYFFLKHYIFSETAGAEALREMLGESSMSALARDAVKSKKTISRFGDASAVFEWATIFDLAQIAEDKTPFQEQIRQSFGVFRIFFPEVSTDNPLLAIKKTVFELAQLFDVGVFLKSYLLKRRSVIQTDTKRRYSKEKLAQELGISRAAVSNYIEKKNKPRQESVLKNIARLIYEELNREAPYLDLSEQDTGQMLLLATQPRLIELFPVAVLSGLDKKIVSDEESEEFLMQRNRIDQIQLPTDFTDNNIHLDTGVSLGFLPLANGLPSLILR